MHEYCNELDVKKPSKIRFLSFLTLEDPQIDKMI